MKVNQLDILMIPDHQGYSSDHWQTRWGKKLSTARHIQQNHQSHFNGEKWINEIKIAIAQSQKPVVIIAHSLGVPAALHATIQSTKKICGAFLVAPPNINNEEICPKYFETFSSYHRKKFPFPSVVIASRNDRFCPFSIAENLAYDWGALFIDAGQSGHIDVESGHGPWPEGLMVLSHFLAKL
ncbi:alpha/beta hydrolase [Bartonella sp. B10]